MQLQAFLSWLYSWALVKAALQHHRHKGRGFCPSPQPLEPPFPCPRFLSKDSRQRRCWIACSVPSLTPLPELKPRLRAQAGDTSPAQCRGRPQAEITWGGLASAGLTRTLSWLQYRLSRLLWALTASAPANTSPGRHHAPCQHPAVSPRPGHGFPEQLVLYERDGWGTAAPPCSHCSL